MLLLVLLVVVLLVVILLVVVLLVIILLVVVLLVVLSASVLLVLLWSMKYDPSACSCALKSKVVKTFDESGKNLNFFSIKLKKIGIFFSLK